jgi:hypothetical protein
MSIDPSFDDFDIDELIMQVENNESDPEPETPNPIFIEIKEHLPSDDQIPDFLSTLSSGKRRRIPPAKSGNSEIFTSGSSIAGNPRQLN